MQGNNKEALKFKKIQIPLIEQSETTYPAPAPKAGIKYFFPENPTIDAGYIVGIEAHLSIQSFVAPSAGDISDLTSFNGINTTNVLNASLLFVNIIGADLDIKFANIPLASLYPLQPGVQPPALFKKTVHPYTGKIKTRASYIWLPPAVIALPANTFVTLTFFYR
jgi:hypothetical protein